MAKATWAQCSPMSGEGNDILAFTAGAHTGRGIRSTIATVQTKTAPTVTKQATINQAALAEFVSGTTSYNVSAATTKIVVSGESNAAKLKFATTNPNLSIPTAYTANGAAATNDTAIANDPGYIAKFAWSIEVTVPQNLTIEQKSFVLTVTTPGGKSLNVSITQAAAAATLVLSTESVTVDDDGTTITMNLTSNASWKIL